MPWCCDACATLPYDFQAARQPKVEAEARWKGLLNKPASLTALSSALRRCYTLPVPFLRPGWLGMRNCISRTDLMHVNLQPLKVSAYMILYEYFSGRLRPKNKDRRYPISYLIHISGIQWSDSGHGTVPFKGELLLGAMPHFPQSLSEGSQGSGPGGHGSRPPLLPGLSRQEGWVVPPAVKDPDSEVYLYRILM